MWRMCRQCCQIGCFFPPNWTTFYDDQAVGTLALTLCCVPDASDTSLRIALVASFPMLTVPVPLCDCFMSLASHCYC